MPRLFISHSSKDNIAALAFQLWLVGKGWGEDDVFIDLHDMRAGEKWRETLVSAGLRTVKVISSPTRATFDT